MLKKVLAFSSLLLLGGCQWGAAPSDYTVLTDQLGGCIQELVAEKGGSVVIKSPAQYLSFNHALNAMGEDNEACASDVTLPEMNFGEAVFVAQNLEKVCGLEVAVDTQVSGEVMTLQFVQAFPRENCEATVSGIVAASVKMPEGVRSVQIK